MCIIQSTAGVIPMKKLTISMVVLVLVSVVCACQPSHNEGERGAGDGSAAVRTPKTSLGQAVESARGVDALAESHNKAIEEQAGE